MRRGRTDIARVLGEVVLGELGRRGTAVTSLSAGTGLTPRALRRCLSGRRPFDMNKLEDVATWLG